MNEAELSLKTCLSFSLSVSQQTGWPGLAWYFPDKSDVGCLTHQSRELVDAVDLLPPEPAHLPGPEQLVPLARRPDAVEAQLDSLHLLGPGVSDGGLVSLPQPLSEDLVLPHPVQQADGEGGPGVPHTDLLATASLGVVCNIVRTR